MTRRRDVFGWLGLLVLAGAAVFGWCQEKQPVRPKQEDQEYTIRTTSRLVLLDVSVKDSAGGFVSGLTKDNFKVYEDGKPQQISQFADADIPVTVGLVVDESGSMRPKRSEVITAAIEFIEASNPQDEVFVINFNEKARRGLPDIMLFSDNIDTLRSALWQGIPEGRTALYDAMEMALHQLDMGRRDKKTLVLISDGGDNISVHKLPEVMHDVLSQLATIYTIGIFDEDDPERNPAVLEKLSRVSGGVPYFPKKLEEITPICKQIAKDIRTRYTIGYIPTSEGKPERRIKVVASSPEHPKLIVRTRTNYLYTPDAEASNIK
ncbi:MAG TPA: VWA domain-containing protein [Bryobacteraceae bacterium]|nr:VWA domain-containing protein [Bryobacteraceae bacterium]